MSNKIYELFEKLSRGVQAANVALADADLFADHKIDEVALMFSSQNEAWKFIHHAVEVPGVKLFNAAIDTVQTYPIRSKYGVQYYFLETPWEYRVECMVLAGGLSPLHAALVSTHYDQVGDQLTSGIVHYSFKTTDELQYQNACKAMEIAEWTSAQVCHSTYGTFSYWLTDEETDRRVFNKGYDWKAYEAYIKPRVNLRDTVSDAAMEYLGSKA